MQINRVIFNKEIRYWGISKGFKILKKINSENTNKNHFDYKFCLDCIKCVTALN